METRAAWKWQWLMLVLMVPGRMAGQDLGERVRQVVAKYDSLGAFICCLSNKRTTYFKEMREELSNLLVNP